MKNDLRKHYKRLRNEIPKDLHLSWSNAIIENVIALLESDFKGANIFLCFYPFGSEVNLLPLYDRLLSEGKTLYFPVSNIDSHVLTFHKVTNMKKDFKKGFCDIMEPCISNEVFDMTNDEVICITPGLVFDKGFNRMGYGAGFYDRFLFDKKNIIKIAPIFSKQLVDRLDAGEHDIPMDYIVTENGILRGE